jgi:bilirubin oxidase
MLWYHDHALDNTARNEYFGQAGAYIIQDPSEKDLNLPSTYGTNDIPLILEAKYYDPNGSLLFPNDPAGLYGDTVQVNGQPWPYLAVEPRKYRLRILDAAASRTFALYMERDKAPGTKLPFQVIASDAGLLTKPVTTTDLTITTGERWEIVVDFAQWAGQNVTMRNARQVGDSPDYPDTDKVMRFVVGSKKVADNTQVPQSLRADALMEDSNVAAKRTFVFGRNNVNWTINGVVFSDPEQRVLAKPEVNTTEDWTFVNQVLTHPVHIHLVDFRILSRSGGPRASSGSNSVLPYEAAGNKDVVWLDFGETVTVRAKYGPYNGEYVFHCHNLVHGDHEMMAAMNVSQTRLNQMGYDTSDGLWNPMDKRFAAKKAVSSDYTPAAVKKAVQSLTALGAY